MIYLSKTIMLIYFLPILSDTSLVRVVGHAKILISNTLVIVFGADFQWKTRLKTLRTAFSKLVSLPPSGSGADRLTPRQKEILEMCSFLRCHVRNRDSVTTLQKSRFVMVSL